MPVRRIAALGVFGHAGSLRATDKLDRSDWKTMAHSRHIEAVPSPGWHVPATMWQDVISRYVLFVQVPTWKVSVKNDGSEKRTCLPAAEAEALGAKMVRTIERLFPRFSESAEGHKANREDLAVFLQRQGRHIPSDQRCAKEIGSHLQRAFLFNDAGYTCLYCRRSASGVYAEEYENERPRTLRFEIDHRRTRRRLPDQERFDPENLVVACRSCNTIKGEMPERRFMHELESLSSAVLRKA